MKLTFWTVFLIFPFVINAAESCFYSSKKHDGSFSSFDDCGVVENEKLKLTKHHLKNISFIKDNLACVMISIDEVFYVHLNGQSQRVLFYDNGCDYFKEGLARGIIKDKMVFINRNLDVVISPGFDYASSFHYGHAVVCKGPFKKEKHGEHAFLQGGKCGLIDKQGNLVVETNYKLEEKDVFQNYINSNNHCPPPPVSTKESALCHAKRHVSYMKEFSNNWSKHRLTNQKDFWVISFIEEGKNKQEYTLLLNKINAHWNSLIKESHKDALLRLEN